MLGDDFLDISFIMSMRVGQFIDLMQARLVSP